MAAWVVQALATIARFGRPVGQALVGTPGRALGTGAALGGLAAGGIPFVDLFPDGGGGRPRRRRRRRALTASDRADISFIEAVLGKAAGRSFAMLVVSRTTA